MSPGSALGRRLSSWQGRPVAVLSASAALLVAGLWAALTLPLEWSPAIELPEVRIRATWPGASPRAMERYVTVLLEQAVESVPGTAEVESYSEAGSSFVRLAVARSVDMEFYVAEVLEQLASLRRVLPPQVVPRLERKLPEAIADEADFMTLQLTGPAAEGLRRLAERRLAPALQSLPGVAAVAVEGGQGAELLIALDPYRMEALGVSPDEVLVALSQALADRAYGRLRIRRGQPLLLAPAADRVAELARLPVGTVTDARPLVHLEDVAQLRLGPAVPQSVSRVDGDPVVTLGVSRTPGSHLLQVAARVHGKLAELRRELPQGTRLLVADDQSERIEGQLRSLAVQGVLGLVLVVLALVVCLRSLRAAAIVLASGAQSLAFGLALMHVVELTLNPFTLAGLALAFGLLADNAVVVIERLQRERARLPPSGGSEPALATPALERVLASLWVPLLGGTLATLAVLVPLVYLSGELRALFLPFGLVLGLTLAASLASSVILVPVLARVWPIEAKRAVRTRWWRRLAAGYAPAVRFPRTVLLLLLLAMGTPFWLLPERLAPRAAGWSSEPARRAARLYDATLGSAAVRRLRPFLDPALGGVLRPFVRTVGWTGGRPFDDGGEVVVRLRLPGGSGLERMDPIARRFERRALSYPEVTRTLARVTEDTAILRVQFQREALLSGRALLVREGLIRESLPLAGVEIFIQGLVDAGYSSGSGEGVTGLLVEAYGPDFDGLERVAADFATRLEDDPRVVRVDIDSGRFGLSSGRDILRLYWGGAETIKSGVDAQGLAATLRASLNKSRPTLFAELDLAERLPVRLVTGSGETAELAELLAVRLETAGGAGVRLGGVAEPRPAREIGGIERLNQQYRRYVRVEYRGTHQLGSSLIEREMAAARLPAGYRLEVSEFDASSEREIRQMLLWLLAGAILATFLIMASVFESWWLPWVVLLTVPVVEIGVALGFVALREPFGQGALIALILLVGVSVNNHILLVDRYRSLRLRRPSLPVRLAAWSALRGRLRPMWATTLAAVAGMLPIFFLEGESGFWVNLAVTTVGGLLASTVLGPAVALAVLSRWGGSMRA